MVTSRQMTRALLDKYRVALPKNYLWMLDSNKLQLPAEHYEFYFAFIFTTPYKKINEKHYTATLKHSIQLDICKSFLTDVQKEK